jgi:hypothetical protein
LVQGNRWAPCLELLEPPALAFREIQSQTLPIQVPFCFLLQLSNPPRQANQWSRIAQVVQDALQAKRLCRLNDVGAQVSSGAHFL